MRLDVDGVWQVLSETSTAAKKKGDWRSAIGAINSIISNERGYREERRQLKAGEGSPSPFYAVRLKVK